MSDIDLRRLERIYHQDPSPQTLLALNIQRVRLGLDPIRPNPHYLRQWAMDIYTIINSSDEYIPFDEEDDAWSSFEGTYEDGFRGYLPFYKTKTTPIVTISVEMYANRATPKGGDAMIINMEPLHNALSVTRTWQVRARLSDNMINVLTPDAPPDWSLRIPYEKSQSISNRFLSAQELIDYLMGIYRQEVKISWNKLLENTVLDKNQFINILEVIDILRRKKWFSKHSTSLMKQVIASAWFQEALGAYADEVEADLRREDLVFDSEQRWPITIYFNGNQYILKLETGYNDTVDPEEFDESEPEGKRYGDVNQFMDQISNALEKISRTEWDVEWDYEEEYEKDSEDIAISVKVETPLTYEFLLHLLK